MQLELQHVDPHADPHDVIAAQLRNLAPRGGHDPSQLNVTPAASPEPASKPPFSTAPLNDNIDDIYTPAPRAKFGRGVVGLIVCAGIAAAAIWHSYGEDARQRLSHLVPQPFAGTTTPQSAAAAEPQDVNSQITAPQPAADPAPAQDAAAVPATPPEPATASSTPAVETPSTQAALTPELAQSIATMAREIASLKQTVEQLQTGQQQLSRDVAKATEETRRKPVAQTSKPALPPRPQRTSAPAPVTRSAQPTSSQAYPQGQIYPQGGAAHREAYIPPQPAPSQLPPPPGDSSVPRPPMPLR